MYRYLIPICSFACSLFLLGTGMAYGQNQLRNTTENPRAAFRTEESPEGDRSRGSTNTDQPFSESYEMPDPLFAPMTTAMRSTVLNAELDDYELLELDPEGAAQLLAEAPDLLELSLPTTDEPLDLILHRVDLAAEGFSVREAGSGQVLNEASIGIHYRGHLRAQPDVPVAFSLSEHGGIYSLIALPDQNLVLGPVKDPLLGDEAYVLYADDQLADQASFTCQTADTEVAYDPGDLRSPTGTDSGRSSNSCVRIYLEVDHDIYLNKGGTAGAAAYISAAFNEVAALYQVLNVNLTISEILVWDTPSPYTANSSSGRLSMFQSTRTSFNGDLAQLLSYGASGGIAVLNGLCHPFTGAKMSFSSIGTSFASVPTYSWTIMVMAHEFGHQLGSQHTHACVWNGNGTAIDGCPNFTEGNCPIPGSPAGGGNIMSYCHLNQVGINFNVGFGQQPAAIISNTVNAASCLTGNCSGGGGDNPPPPPPPSEDCTSNTVYLRLAPDNYGPETRWRIRNEAGTTIASGGPYDKMLAGTLILDTLCLPDGCYDFTISDSYGDGICCAYGNGSIRLTEADGQIILNNNDYEDELDETFCVPGGSGPGGDDCLAIDFDIYPPISYGLNQDNGQISVQQQGNQIYMRNNAWKAIELPYTLTPETVLEFDFRSTIQGEIHGIGFDDDLSISAQFTFKLHGTQNWGNAAFDNYSGNGQWQQFTIPVGQYLLGDAQYMFFVADHDNGLRNGNSYFRNIRLYEGAACEERPTAGSDRTNSQSLDASAVEIGLWPNPSSGQIHISRPAEIANQSAIYTLSNADGRVILTDRLAAHASQARVDLSDQPAGSYVLQYTDGQTEEVVRFQLLPNR
ncbi:MAG: M12 family metallo-peptidase [Bacteroidota bacterium]